MVRRWSNLGTSFKILGNFYLKSQNLYLGQGLRLGLRPSPIFNVSDSPLSNYPNELIYNSRPLIWFKKSYNLRAIPVITLNLYRRIFAQYSSKLTINLHYFISKYKLSTAPLPSRFSFFLKPVDGSFMYLARSDFKIFRSLKFSSLFLQLNDVNFIFDNKNSLKTYKTLALYCLEFLQLTLISMRFKQSWLELPRTLLIGKSGFFKLPHCSFFTTLTHRPNQLSQLSSEFFVLRRAAKRHSNFTRITSNSLMSSHLAANSVITMGFYLGKSKLNFIYKLLINLFLWRGIDL